MWTMAILAVVAFLALRVARGVFRWFVRLLLLLVAVPAALFGMVAWQAYGFTSQVQDQLHVGMTHEQARNVVQRLEVHDQILAVPKDLAHAKEWQLVRPIGFFRARVHVAFDHGKVASLRPDFTFD